jgi:hypothetical protein
MSNDLPEDAVQFASTAKKLLVEYTEKLEELRKDLISIHDKKIDTKEEWSYWASYYDSRVNFFHQFQHQLHTLARAASQRIQHGKLSDAARLELEIRSGELEAKLFEFQNIMNFAKPKQVR